MVNPYMDCLQIRIIIVGQVERVRAYLWTGHTHTLKQPQKYDTFIRRSEDFLNASSTA